VSRSLKAHLLLVLVTFVWGATFVVIKNALADISPLLFNAVRMVLAAIVLALIYWKSVRRIDRRVLRSGALVGLFLWAGYEFQTTGLRLTTPSKSAFLTGMSVLLVPVFTAVFWRKLVSFWAWLGVVLAFVGLYFLTVPAADPNAHALALSSINFGDVLTICCAVAFAFQIITLGRATQRYPFEQVAFLQTAVAALLMSATVPLVESAHAVWSTRVITAILVTGLLGTAGAFTVQAWAQQFLPATHTALIFALEPVFAWITSYIVLGERLGIRAVVGAALNLGGIVLAEVRGAAATHSMAEEA
jgi:drug/metabolite transporter (DMT)-like permease